MSVYLGGTIESDWRQIIIPLLKVEYVNPVENYWSPDLRAKTISLRDQCEYSLYCITPNQIGFYAIAELIQDAHVKRGRCIYCMIDADKNENDSGAVFTDRALLSLESVGMMVLSLGACWVPNLRTAANVINEGLEVSLSAEKVELV